MINWTVDPAWQTPAYSEVAYVDDYELRVLFLEADEDAGKEASIGWMLYHIHAGKYTLLSRATNCDTIDEAKQAVEIALGFQPESCNATE